jgi:hypothetical protein
MAISDLFSTSFLFSIAIIIILIGGIFAYVSYRMSEQDHKLTTMVNLVSILAHDLQIVKSKISSEEEKSNIHYSSQMMGGQDQDLISVSDDGDETDEEEDIDDNTTVDNTTDEEPSYSSDQEDEHDDDHDDEHDDEHGNEDKELFQQHIKLLNLTLANEDIVNDSPIEELNSNLENSATPNNEDIKTIHLETPINFEESEITIPLESNQNNTAFLGEDISFLTNDSFTLKNVTINDLGEAEDLHASKSEYKKMSLTKLREVAISKGVVSDASKLKKNEILKMLGDE